MKNKKIYLFETAKHNELAPKCTIFENMKEKNWEWFNFKASQELVEIPFARDFKNLKPADQESYKNFQNDKMKLYKDYSEVMKLFLDKAVSHTSKQRISYEKELILLE